jgi:imidazolonepropionase-like amidohydrolase
LGFTRIKMGRLLDGRGSTGMPHAAVLIDDDRILEAGPATMVSRPKSAQVLEFHGATALPGLIDCHAHLTMPGDGTSVEAVA